MAWEIRGLIEGFYGPPWSWDERVEVMGWCHERGMTHYVYAPKDDPLHRARWREPYPADELAGFERLVTDGGLRIGFALSPGLSIDYGSRDDRTALAAKIDQVVDLGIDLVCLALDDIPVRPALGDDHATLTTWLRGYLADRADLVLVPTEYTGSGVTPYLDALASGVPADVPVAWTGRTVVCDTITTEDAENRSAALGDRAPLVWDNYPVNDAVMGDRLFLGPLRGRDPGLADVCCGFMANPMVQPRASKLPLASIAAYLRGHDPVEAWGREADAMGLRILAEACDGEHPGELVEALRLAEDEDARAKAMAGLRRWLEAAQSCAAPGLAGEADPWIEQTHREAQAGLAAVGALEALRPVGPPGAGGPDLKQASELALLTAALWQALPRGEVTAMGPRRSFRPVISQRENGDWRFHRASVELDRNAIDHLVGYTFDLVSAAD